MLNQMQVILITSKLLLHDVGHIIKESPAIISKNVTKPIRGKLNDAETRGCKQIRLHIIPKENAGKGC